MRLSFTYMAVLAISLTCLGEQTVSAQVGELGPRMQYYDKVFWANDMPGGDSVSNALFRDCCFICDSDTLFLASHADQMVLIDCTILGNGEVKWSRYPSVSDRNYISGLVRNGYDYVIEQDGTSSVELEGLPLADELLKPEPQYATQLKLVASVDYIEPGGNCQVDAVSDAPLPGGFLGWRCDDSRVKLVPSVDGMSCIVYAEEHASPYMALVQSFGLNGVECALNISVGQPVSDMPSVELPVVTVVKKGLFGRLFKRKNDK